MCEYTSVVHGSRSSVGKASAGYNYSCISVVLGNSSTDYNHSRIITVHSRISAFPATIIHRSQPSVHGSLHSGLQPFTDLDRSWDTHLWVHRPWSQLKRQQQLANHPRISTIRENSDFGEPPIHMSNFTLGSTPSWATT